MTIAVLKEPVSRTALSKIADSQFGDLVKAVVDIKNEIMAVGGELHADEEALLMEQGSEQEYLWGINLYPAKEGEDFIEFDSMINVRPSQGNASRGVEDTEVHARIVGIVHKLIPG